MVSLYIFSTVRLPGLGDTCRHWGRRLGHHHHRCFLCVLQVSCNTFIPRSVETLKSFTLTLLVSWLDSQYCGGGVGYTTGYWVHLPPITTTLGILNPQVFLPPGYTYLPERYLVPDILTLPLNRLTDTCEKITLPQLLLRAVTGY